jgi:pimeloyl-ACP methyl ester carboxylesterase
MKRSLHHYPPNTHKELKFMVHYRNIAIDGVSVFYREAGIEGRPALLLLHGFPASSFMFRDLIGKLEDQFHLIAPDYPGFGYSGAPSSNEFSYTFDRLADVVETFTQKLGLQRYALYMQDFGGPVGFRLAARHPERVTALIIQNANAYEEGLPDRFWGLARALWSKPSEANFAAVREAAMSPQALEWNYTHGVRDISSINPDNWTLQKALLDRPGNKEIMAALLYDYRNNLPLYPRWQEYLRQHQPPTLIIWGKNDAIFPPSGAYPYQRDLEAIEFNLLDTGHFALEEKADTIAERIKGFLSRQSD